MKPYVPVDNVLIAASSLAGSMAYAGVGQVDQTESHSRSTRAQGSQSSLRELGGLRKFRLSSRPCPCPKTWPAGACSTSFNLNRRTKIIMSNPTTLQSSSGLSNILGAYDMGTGKRSRLAQARQRRLASWKRALGCRGRHWQVDPHRWNGEATAYGILLDASVDTAVPNSTGTVTGSVARAGSFRGAALIVGAGTDEALTRQGASQNRNLRGRPDHRGDLDDQEPRRNVKQRRQRRAREGIGGHKN